MTKADLLFLIDELPADANVRISVAAGEDSSYFDIDIVSFDGTNINIIGGTS